MTYGAIEGRPREFLPTCLATQISFHKYAYQRSLNKYYNLNRVQLVLDIALACLLWEITPASIRRKAIIIPGYIGSIAAGRKNLLSSTQVGPANIAAVAYLGFTCPLKNKAKVTGTTTTAARKPMERKPKSLITAPGTIPATIAASRSTTTITPRVK